MGTANIGRQTSDIFVFARALGNDSYAGYPQLGAAAFEPDYLRDRRPRGHQRAVVRKKIGLLRVPEWIRVIRFRDPVVKGILSPVRQLLPGKNLP